MALGERVRDLMAEQGLSQAELARRVGVKQPSIYAIINRNKTGTRTLHKLARELQTTPAYLTGETDDPNADAPDAPVLDAESREIIEHLGHLAPADRKALLQIARTMAGGPAPSTTVHEPEKGYRGEDKG